MRRAVIMIIVLLLLICMQGPQVCGSATASLSKKDFLNLLAALQRQVRNLSWSAHTQTYDVDIETGELRKTPYYSNVKVIMAGEPGTRIRVDYDRGLPWIVGGSLRAKPGLRLGAKAFNGKIGTHIERMPVGADKAKPINQEITADRPKVGMLRDTAGLNLFAPYYENVGLAQYFGELDEGKWQLLIGDQNTCTISENVEDVGRREITVNLAKGGAITGIKYVLMGSVTGEYRNIILKEYDKGVWLPVSAEFVDILGPKTRRIKKIVFEEIKTNQDLPESTFVLDFVPGYQVYDKIANIKYIAGHKNDEDRINEIDEALEDIPPLGKITDAASQPPAPVKAQAATPAEAGPGEPEASGSRLWLVVALVAAAVVGAVLVVFLARRGRASKVLLLFVLTASALVSPPCSSRCLAASSITEVPENPVERITAVPWVVRIDESDFADGDTVEREVRFRGRKENEKALRLTGVERTASWVRAAIARNTDSAAAHDETAISLTVAKPFAPGASRAEVKCAFEGLGAPVVIEVRRYRAPSFTVTPALASLSGGRDAEVTVRLLPTDLHKEYGLVSVSAPPNLQIHWEKTPHSGPLALKIRLVGKAGATKGASTIEKVSVTIDQGGDSQDIPVYLLVDAGAA